MKCPDCGYNQSEHVAVCGMCGSLLRTQQDRRPFLRSAPEPPKRQYSYITPLTRATKMYAAVGFGMAVCTLLMTLPSVRQSGLMGFFLNIPNIALGGFSTLVHETGHSIFGWVFGYPSIPAFDLRYGGGVAMEFGTQKHEILVLVYIAFAVAFWMLRRNRPGVIALSLLLVVYSTVAFTGLRKPIMIFMGHGTELVFATLALYRGFSGTSVAHELERLAYSLVGWFLVLHNLIFAWGLATSERARFWYGEAKGGGHWMDFDVLARQYLHIPLWLVAAFFLLCCLLPPVIAFLAHRYRALVSAWIDTLTEAEV